MRRSVRLWLAVALALSGCSGDYPLPPTACDRFCHATESSSCYGYDPAECVLQCERSRQNAPACADELSAVTSCYQNTPGVVAVNCSLLTGKPCNEEYLALQNCWSSSRFDDFRP